VVGRNVVVIDEVLNVTDALTELIDVFA